MSGRHTCPGCGRSQAAYCPDCLRILEEPPPPQLRLPVKVDVVLHHETNARSTALHAVLLAPADVTLHRHDGSRTGRRCSPLDLDLPSYDPGSTVVLFPEGPGTEELGAPGAAPFQRVVVLESSWKKARGLLQLPALAPLRRVALPPAGPSQFDWRRGDGSFKGAVEEGMSSIEAIYHCCRLLGGAQEGGAATSYEGLLRYFRQTRERVAARGPLPTSRQEARARQAADAKSSKRQKGAAGQQMGSEAETAAAGGEGTCRPDGAGAAVGRGGTAAAAAAAAAADSREAGIGERVGPE